MLRSQRRVYEGVAKRHGRRTAGAIMAVALASRFWRLGCPKIYHEVATRLLLFVRGSVDTNKAKAGKHDWAVFL
ncbi:hypothetical protein, partial [Thiolapillus sp.]|uniref:hypothetical protein n=1 Tax=Thiolapillus sp. TaxID=2017437 RepID=UPI003AF9EE99